MEILLELGTCQCMTLAIHVFEKAINETLGINQSLFQAEPQVEKVSSLAPLIKRSQLGGQQFVNLERSNLTLAGEPGIGYRELELIQT